MELQKKLPYDEQLEEAILGAILLESGCMVEISDFLKPSMFYSAKNRLIYEACYFLFNDNKPIDILTVTQHLRANGHLNNNLTAYDITVMTNRVASTSNIEYHARIIAELFMKREIYKHAKFASEKAIDEDVDIFTLIDVLYGSIDDVLQGVLTGEIESIEQILDDVENQILNTSNQKVSGITSGLTELDNMTSGFQPSDMIVLAARPAMGKSALMTTMIKACAKSGKPCAVFSLEMSKFQLICRMLSEEVKISSNELVKKQLTEYQKKLFKDGLDSIRHLPIHIDDKAGLTITELRAKMKRLKKLHDIQFAVIDYLQLMAGTKGKGNREQEISEISRGVKLIAKELNIPIIALSQLSRSVETRGGGKIPQLSDLRESGAIEQDADIVMFIHRPQYYGIEIDEDGESTLGRADLIIAKHRNGDVGVVKTEFVGQYTCFRDWTRVTNNNFYESKF